MWFSIAVLIILILVNAFFASSEIALISLNDEKVRRMAEAGDKNAKVIMNLTKEPSAFLATIQVGVTLSGFLASAFAAESFATRLTNWIMNMNIGLNEGVVQTISLICITLLLSYITLVFGELVPKRIGMQRPESIAMRVARPLSIIAKISKPFVRFLSLSTNTVIRLLGQDPHAEEETVTEEEIRMMVDVGEEKGVIQEAEKIMISNVLEFNDKTVENVMVHRTNIVGVKATASIREVVSVFLKEQYTRIVIYKNTIDTIIGVLNVKDLLPHVMLVTDKDVAIEELVRQPLFLLEATKTSDAFQQLQKEGSHLAIVVDEYGGTSGLITLEDLVEEIVGNIRDEHDVDEMGRQLIQKVNADTFIVEGTTSLYELNDLLSLNIEAKAYGTVGGFVMGQLGRVIHEGETPSFVFENYRFTVMKAVDNRIVSLTIQKLPHIEADSVE